MRTLWYATCDALRNLWYGICDTLDDFKEHRFMKRSLSWDALDIITDDTPILDFFLLLMEIAAFLCYRKKRR